MGKRSRIKRQRKERVSKIQNITAQAPSKKALAAYTLYATNPIYKHLVDTARAVKRRRERKPLTVALQRLEAEARLKPIFEAQMEAERQWYRAVYMALPAPREDIEYVQT